jgi:hypothetical protein
LGYTSINLVDDPIPALKFGQWNPRKIDQKIVNVMVNDFVAGKGEPWISPLVLIVSKKELHPNQNHSSPDLWSHPSPGLLAQLPRFLPLSNIHYRVAGGNHRITATKAALEKFVLLLEKQNKTCSMLEKSILESPAGDVSHIAELTKAKDYCKKEIAILEKWKTTIKTWPAQIFDDG